MQVDKQRTNRPAGYLSPCPGNGTQHDSEGTGCQDREEAEVEHTLHPVVAHPHHRIQVVLQRSNAKHSVVKKMKANVCISRLKVKLGALV